MRAVWVSALVMSTSIGCAPPEASVPESDDRPCRTDEDCELAANASPTRSQICSTRVAGPGSSLEVMSADAARCGPMARMQPASPEPVLACFRGACVPIGSR